LSVTRLGTLLGHAPSEIPATREVASVVAGFWVDYQLLAAAAADGDSLTNQKEIDEATSQYTDNMLLQHMEQHIDSSFPPVQPTEQTYNSALGELYAARHILFRLPLAATQAQKDSVHRVAAKILPQVNNANFAAMAKKYSGDDVSAAKGGDVGVFARDGMVAEFGDAVAALKPGQISPLVASQYGYHIIQRLPYSQVKDEYDKRFTQFAATVGEREYLSRLESAANIQVKAGAAAVAKVAVLDPQGRRKDQSVLATYNGGPVRPSPRAGTRWGWTPRRSPTARARRPNASAWRRPMWNLLWMR
jgi:parvulin-like peptidyl-prolyl isomerase